MQNCLHYEQDIYIYTNTKPSSDLLLVCCLAVGRSIAREAHPAPLQKYISERLWLIDVAVGTVWLRAEIG